MATAASAQLEARWIGRSERAEAVAFLARDALSNLYLLDLANRVGGGAAPGEARPEVLGVWRGDVLAGVTSLRPSVVFDAGAGTEMVEVLLPTFETVGMGLVKSAAPLVEELWSRLSRRRRRRALLDRIETAYVLRPGRAGVAADAPVRPARAAVPADLEALVIAARESLREEQRPDPFEGDVAAFRRWVRGRVERARVVECEGRIVFAGYADVQRPEGWLLQGVYTWPEVRRRGFARAGVAALCREAFAAGADHVQLTVVAGNGPGHRLYQALGFEPFAELRTILFT